MVYQRPQNGWTPGLIDPDAARAPAFPMAKFSQAEPKCAYALGLCLGCMVLTFLWRQGMILQEVAAIAGSTVVNVSAIEAGLETQDRNLSARLTGVSKAVSGSSQRLARLEASLAAQNLTASKRLADLETQVALVSSRASRAEAGLVRHQRAARAEAGGLRHRQRAAEAGAAVDTRRLQKGQQGILAVQEALTAETERQQQEAEQAELLMSQRLASLEAEVEHQRALLSGLLAGSRARASAHSAGVGAPMRSARRARPGHSGPRRWNKSAEEVEED